MRAQIEQTLRKAAPGSYQKPIKVQDEEFDPFLIRVAPNGREIKYFCDSEMVSVEFGNVGTHIDWNPAEDEVDEDSEEEEAEAPDPKVVLKMVLQTTLDIVTERVFAAEYRKLHAKVSKLHPAAQFSGLKSMQGFTSRSWDGKYDYP